MINVALGGILHADIHEAYAHAPRLRTVLPRKTIHITKEAASTTSCNAIPAG